MQTTIFGVQQNTKLKSPLNYIGGKYKLLPQILPLFPAKIDSFVDLFAGGCNVIINTNANKYFANDNLSHLIDMYKLFANLGKTNILSHIRSRIKEFDLSKINESGYKSIRDLYNKDKNPLDLFVLIAYSFNHQIRFNNSHGFNNPFGRNRSSFNANMERNLITFIDRIVSNNISFSSKNFDDFDISHLSSNDFVYCDPPYLITTGTYNDGKRGFTGWDSNCEKNLLSLLLLLDSKGVKFALSNVTHHKGSTNNLLLDWVNLNAFNTHYLNMDYSNSNYQSNSTPSKSIEVLITNY